MDYWPIAIHPLAGCACGVMLWRHGAHPRASLVVKATFALRPNAAMVLAEPQPVLRADRHHEDSPAKSLRQAKELIPYRAKCDVTLEGSACAPAGQATPAMSVRLLVSRGAEALMSRTAHVFGDRALGADGTPGAPEPFTRMPLVYERATRSDANPSGVRGGKKAPNLIDAADPQVAAGFGPISRYAASRRALLGQADPKALDEAVAAVPDGFDWSYFQAAPEAQRCELLRGDEWVVLDGMNAEHARLASALPKAMAHAFLVPLSPQAAAAINAESVHSYVPVALVADGLHVDAQALLATVTWRGVVLLRSEEHLAELAITAGVALGGASLAWPAASELAALVHAVRAPAAQGEPAPVLDATASIAIGQGTGPVIPFDGEGKPIFPWAAEVSSRPTPQVLGEGEITVADDSGSTLTISAADRAGVASLLAPFALAAPRGSDAAKPGASGAAAAPAAEAQLATQTLSISHLSRALELGRAPYALAQAGQSQPAVAPEGAPFSRVPARPVSLPVGDRTVDLGVARAEAEAVSTSRFFHELPREGRAKEPEPSLEPAAPRLGPRRIEGIPIVNHTFMHVAYAPWQHRPPRDSLTMIVKGSFSLVLGAPAMPCEESELCTGDVHRDDDLDGALLYPSDFLRHGADELELRPE